MLQSGMQSSYLEGAVFEQLIKRERGSGVSAVQILQDAIMQNIPIYMVSPSNINTLMPLLNISAEVSSDIVNAVNTGKSVLIPGRPPTHGGWSGIGYVVLDTQTGAGAYLINGHLNGGQDAPCQNEKSLAPVVSTIVQIAFAVILVIILTTIIIEALPAIIAAGGAGLATAGSLMAKTLVLLGLGTLALPASAGSMPGINLTPPGDCSDQQYTLLKADVWLKCSGSGKQSCVDGMLCSDIPIMISRAQACIAARSLINTTCFRGGDEIHLNEINNRQNGIKNCLCILNGGRCVP